MGGYSISPIATVSYRTESSGQDEIEEGVKLVEVILHWSSREKKTTRNRERAQLE